MLFLVYFKKCIHHDKYTPINTCFAGTCSNETPTWQTYRGYRMHNFEYTEVYDCVLM